MVHVWFEPGPYMYTIVLDLILFKSIVKAKKNSIHDYYMYICNIPAKHMLLQIRVFK